VDKTNHQQQPTTTDEEKFDIDSLIRTAHFHTLTEQQQELYLRHLEDQFNAVPSYVERFKTNQ